MKKITTIGHSNHDLTIIIKEKFMNEGLEPDILIPFIPADLVIDNKQYQKIQVSSKHTSSIAKTLIMMYTGIEGYGARNDSEKLEDDQVIKEYRLIIAKKSKLSRKQREYIVKTFNYRYKLIHNEKEI